MGTEARVVYKRGIDYFEQLRSIQNTEHWINVYLSFARMDEVHGYIDQANDIYQRACYLFPSRVDIVLNWAKMLSRKKRYPDKTLKLFKRATDLAGNNNADPYRIYAEYEMSVENFQRAQSIFFIGAQSVTNSIDGDERGLAMLFNSWAQLEWNIFGNYQRAEVLYQKASQVTNPMKKSHVEYRTKIFSSIAEFHFRKQNYRLAQHFICLHIIEDETGGSPFIWQLWSKVFRMQQQFNLASRCLDQKKKQTSRLS